MKAGGGKPGVAAAAAAAAGAGSPATAAPPLPQPPQQQPLALWQLVALGAGGAMVAMTVGALLAVALVASREGWRGRPRR